MYAWNTCILHIYMHEMCNLCIQINAQYTCIHTITCTICLNKWSDHLFWTSLNNKYKYILAEIPVSPGLGLRPRSDLQRPPRSDLNVSIYNNLRVLTTFILWHMSKFGLLPRQMGIFGIRPRNDLQRPLRSDLTVSFYTNSRISCNFYYMTHVQIWPPSPSNGNFSAFGLNIRLGTASEVGLTQPMSVPGSQRFPMPNFSLLGQTVWPPNLDTQTHTHTHGHSILII